MRRPFFISHPPNRGSPASEPPGCRHPQRIRVVHVVDVDDFVLQPRVQVFEERDADACAVAELIEPEWGGRFGYKGINALA